MNALEKLAAWNAATAPVDSPVALRRAADAVIDTFACILSSADEAVVRSVAATVTAGPGGNESCTIPGLPCAAAPPQGRLDCASFSPHNLADPALQKLMARITVEGCPSDSPAAHRRSASAPRRCWTNCGATTATGKLPPGGDHWKKNCGARRNWIPSARLPGCYEWPPAWLKFCWNSAIFPIEPYPETVPQPC